ncbi:uncharacterized protein LOC120354775 [Nilaparvata lugens]|uniref:uncharacterized protein LOC120354775 n=1 Tax=Nilaparvata lugens TaxID=108931 RepID=UPI00193D017F|nr:uncharacterized protein LOC120354775 [Nilaparvata lugens]
MIFVFTESSDRMLVFSILLLVFSAKVTNGFHVEKYVHHSMEYDPKDQEGEGSSEIVELKYPSRGRSLGLFDLLTEILETVQLAAKADLRRARKRQKIKLAYEHR